MNILVAQMHLHDMTVKQVKTEIETKTQKGRKCIYRKWAGKTQQLVHKSDVILKHFNI